MLSLLPLIYLSSLFKAGANLSRLRSPRIWGSDGSALNTSPLPYTPPPMLSPNRRGSGLFSSLTRWPSTASPVVANRRYSSYYPFTSSSSVQSNGDMVKRKSTNLPTVPFGSSEADGGQMLKRSYTGRLMEPGNTEINNAFSLNVTTGGTSSGVGFVPLVHGPRQFALPKRRCQLTPKSAPVLLQEASTSMLQKSVPVSTLVWFQFSAFLFGKYLTKNFCETCSDILIQ